MAVSRLGRMATFVSEQQIRLCLPQRNGQQRKRPHPSVSDAGSAATAMSMVYPSGEWTDDRYFGDGISISPGRTRRKGKLEKIVRK